MADEALSVDDINEALDAPTRADFRRVGRGIPYVMLNGKRARYSRSSNAGKILDDESALTDWRLRTMLVGASYRPELMALVATLDADADKKQIRDIGEECLAAGKGMRRNIQGVAVHSMLDHFDMQDGWLPPDNYAGAVKAYADALAQYGLVVVDIECHCVNDDFRLAGTMDRRYRTTRNLLAPDLTTIAIGDVLAGDTKTGSTLEYAQGSYSTQITAYATSLRYDVLTDERSEFNPPTNRDWGLVMHVVAEDSRCDVYWVDLNAGIEGLRLAEQVKSWRKRTDLLLPAKPPSWPVAVASHPAPQPAIAPPAEIRPDWPLEAPQANATHAQRWQWVRGRVQAIQAVPAALAMLLRTWPEGVAGLKENVHSFADLAAIASACDEVEKEYSLPFPTRDPIDSERDALLDAWLLMAETDRRSDVGKALVAFATITDVYSQLEATELLDAALRGIGYEGGTKALAEVRKEDGELLHHAISLILSDAYSLRYIDGSPVMFAKQQTK